MNTWKEHEIIDFMLFFFWYNHDRQHNPLALEMVSHYDVIFLPTFEAKGMVARKHKKVRAIRRNTCPQMLDLNHYGFKLRLKRHAKESKLLGA